MRIFSNLLWKIKFRHEDIFTRTLVGLDLIFFPPGAVTIQKVKIQAYATIFSFLKEE